MYGGEEDRPEEEHEEAKPGLNILCLAGETWAHIDGSCTHSFDEFIEKFQERIPWIKQAPKEYTYEIARGQTCALTCEDEFQNMISLCNIRELPTVKVGLRINTSSRIHLSDEHNKPSPPTMSGYYKAKKPQTMAEYTPTQRTFTVDGRVFVDVEVQQVSKPKSNKPVMPESAKRQKITPFEKHQFVCEQSMDAAANSSYINVPGEGQFLPDTERKHRKAARQQIGEFYPGATSRLPGMVGGSDTGVDTPALRSAKWVEYITHVGQEFEGGAKEFRAKLVKYSAKLGFQYDYVRNDGQYVKAACKQLNEQGCQWFVRASLCRITDSFFLRDANLIHTCPMAHVSNDPKRLGQRILGGIITESVRSTPHIRAAEIKRDISKNWGFHIDYEKIWRGVEVARANIFGSYHDSFDELRWYTDAIMKTNPGSIVRLDVDPDNNRFKRLFLAFNASLVGFKKCRPMLFIDGTFMKSRYKGTILAATAKDGNNGLFPVAIAVVASENAENWNWFLNKLKEHVHHDREVMYISDRAGGLLNAFNEVHAKPLHFFCLFHLMKNLRVLFGAKKYSDKFKNIMCKLLKDVAYAPTHHKFDDALKAFVKKGSDKAIHFLKDLPYDKWAVAFAPDVHRYGELTSNAAESFNSWILGARFLPVTFMLDCIRQQLMSWFNERREEAGKWTGALTPVMEEKWNQLVAKGENWTILPTNKNGVFEVLAWVSCVVNLHCHTCSCYQWQILGFPCEHAVACIARARWDIREVVESSFFTDTYKQVYVEDIAPIPSTEKHEYVDLKSHARILPPVDRKSPGRPRIHRHRAKGEPKRQQFLCGRCGKQGTHVWTTCADAL